mmetsp:Transcript_12143/g.18258  ORF Transcript_12143/g.18258 Transcript_12143/m.18258 type:complete len:242 (-) Transcript_12143:64-789(-)
MDDGMMHDLLKPISELAGNMSQLEVDDATANAVLAEVLQGQENANDETAKEREERAAKTEARGKALEALRNAQMAARLDAQLQQEKNDVRIRVAIKYYERAAHDFARAIDGGAIREDHLSNTTAAMTAYIDRARALRLQLKEPVFENDGADGEQRRAIFSTLIAATNAPILARGVQTRKLALATDQDWSRFVLLADCADSFMSYIKSLKDQKPPEAILRALQEVLKQMELLAPKLRGEEPS